MPPKKDRDTTPGVKLLRMFRKLMLDGRRHFLSDLAEELQCSSQTILRMASEIESVIGMSLESGLDKRRRYYQIRTLNRSRLGLDFEELRYLSICRDLAIPILPESVSKRINESIFNLSMLLADRNYADRGKVQKPQLAFYSKGRIDYTPHYQTIDKLVLASQERLICLVDYKAPNKDEISKHRFAPGTIVAMSNTLYVLGGGVNDDFKSLKHLTNLAVHRIADVTLTERKFDFSLPDPSPGTFGLPWHEPKVFRIKFAPECVDYIRERIWADQQKFEMTGDGEIILELTTRSEQELQAWVLSFGSLASFNQT
jgi:predicted DNA-binding transcriptional regulator YafY